MISFFVFAPGVNWTLRPKNGGNHCIQAVDYKIIGLSSLLIIANLFNVVISFLSRLFADVLNDIAMFMEILAPYFPGCFTVIVCTAGIFKVKRNNRLNHFSL